MLLPCHDFNIQFSLFNSTKNERRWQTQTDTKKYSWTACVFQSVDFLRRTNIICMCHKASHAGFCCCCVWHEKIQHRTSNEIKTNYIKSCSVNLNQSKEWAKLIVSTNRFYSKLENEKTQRELLFSCALIGHTG